LPGEPLFSKFDRRLISQAMTNVIKNACEGVDAIDESARGKGRIVVQLSVDQDRRAIITVSDNGKGFPAEDRHKLMEPYVTTRAEGTGLGLPIVIKIFEDHGGGVELLDGLERPDGGRGAQVRLALPIVDDKAAEAAPASSDNQRALLH
jgi:two-component system, NtrC family, nitrogen regulation sensor histidine kinase NtrY